MELKEAITDRILTLCQQRGISVNKLCNMSGVTQSTVNNIINRKNNNGVDYKEALRRPGHHPGGIFLDPGV